MNRLPATALLFAIAAAIPCASAQQPRPAWAATLDSIVNSELARTRTPGAAVAVVIDGQLAHAAGYGVAHAESRERVIPQTLFRVGSVTKMFTGATLAQLAAAGTLDLDAPIGSIVPELHGRVAQVTTHQLLTHHAGWIDNAVPYGRMGESALGEVMREVNDTLFFTAPSSVYSYSNPGFSMAGYVAEVAGKARFAALVERTVLRPAGMERATFRPLEALTWPAAHGHTATPQAVAVVRPFTENTAQWAAGFLIASAPELARFTMMLMDGGRAGGQQVLSPAAVRRMTTRHVAIPGTRAEDSVGYGYGLQIARRGEHVTWQHGGSINGFDALVVMVPERRAAVVVLDNLSGAPLNGIVDAALRLGAGISLAAPPAPATPRAPTAADRRALVGAYAMGGRRVELAEEGGALVLRAGTTTGTVQMSGTDALVVATPGQAGTARYIIVMGADGRAAFLHSGGRALARQ